MKAADLDGERFRFQRTCRSAQCYVSASGGDTAKIVGHTAASESKVATARCVDPMLFKAARTGVSPAHRGRKEVA